MNSVKKNFEQISEKLAAYMNGEDGKKITVVMLNDFGCPCVMQMKIHGVKLTSYAQYSNAFEIVCTPKNKRNKYGLTLHEGKNFAIFAGWVSSSFSMPNMFMCFDKGLFYKTVDGVNGEKLGEQSERLYEQEIKEKGKIYKVVEAFGMDGTKIYRTEDELLNAYEKTGEHRASYTRLELQGTPTLRGLCGPMYDGDEDGNAVIRYESSAVNRAFN